MKLLVLSAADVHAVLGYRECADAMRDALTALAIGRAQQPLRTVLRPEGAAGLMALMPSYLAGHAADRPGVTDGAAPASSNGGADLPEPAYGLKAICITSSNPAAGLDTHQGVVLLSRGRTGEPVALLNASAVTEIRTAAVSVVATDLLARPEADVLAVIGAGVQARSHILALDAARPWAEIRVAGRDRRAAERVVTGLAGATAAPLRVCETARDALAGAGVIVTATSSAVPVLDRSWIEPGAHINAVGACLPHARELDTRTVADGALFADRRDSVLAEAGDYLLAAADGVVGPGHIRAELGELLLGAAAGRVNADEITIFESLGLAVEDLAAARLAYRKAVEARAAGVEIGTWISF